MTCRLERVRVLTMTGARALGRPEDDQRIFNGMSEMLHTCSSVEVLRFGGARGADSVALDATVSLLMSLITTHRALAGEPMRNMELQIVVPSKLSDQPSDARAMITRAILTFRESTIVTVRVLELEHPKYNQQRYQARNITMLDGIKTFSAEDPASWRSDALVSFWHGRAHGGTFNTICAAAHRKLIHINFPVEGAADDE